MKKHVVAYARDCWFRFDFRFVILACCDVEETSDGKEPLSVKDGIPRNRSSESAVPTQHRSALSCRAGKTKRTALRESIVANVPAPFQCRLERTKPREREREREREKCARIFLVERREKPTRKREIFSQPFFAGVLGAVVRSRRGDDIVVFSVRAVLLLLMPMPMLVFLSLSRFTLTYDAHTALHIFLDRSIQKRKSTAVAIEEEETHFNFDCMF